jgi:hypothetical protein
MKSSVRWELHIECIGDVRCAHEVIVGKREGKRHPKDVTVDGKIILIRILRN